MSNMELIGGVSAVALILGLVELARRMGLNNKYIPVLSVAFGLLISIGYHYFGNQTWFEAIIIGLVIGLSSIGVSFGTRETIEAFRRKVQ